MDTNGNTFFGGRHAAPRYLVKLAREMRMHPTLAESALWEALRKKRLAHLRFRRQHIIGRYITDFFCFSHRLVVEVDGDAHDPEYDALRDSWMEAQGHSVLRFSNAEVLNDREQVARKIAAVAGDLPLPSPEGGQRQSVKVPQRGI